MPDFTNSVCHVSARSSKTQKVLGGESLPEPLPDLPHSFLLLKGFEDAVEKVPKGGGGKRKKVLGNNVVSLLNNIDVKKEIQN